MKPDPVKNLRTGGSAPSMGRKVCVRGMNAAFWKMLVDLRGARQRISYNTPTPSLPLEFNSPEGDQTY
jgi:hypothetical protein